MKIVKMMLVGLVVVAILTSLTPADHLLSASQTVVDYDWSQDNAGPEKMMRVDQGFCFLSAVIGKFKGKGEGVWIYRQEEYWFLSGQSQQIDVGARARCISYGSFQGARVSKLWEPIILEGGKNHSVNKKLPGKSICYLTGLSGILYGRGEGVNLAVNMGEGFIASAYSQQGYIRGDFGCVDLVDSNNNVIQHPAMSLQWQYFGQADASQGFTYYQLPSANDSFCVLTQVSGRFEGSGELINIDTDGAGQGIIIGSQQYDVGAGVACYNYNQSSGITSENSCNSSADIQPNTSYYLQHKYSGKYVVSGDNFNGGLLWLYAPIPQGHELRYTFQLVPAGGGYYYLWHAFSGKYVASGDLTNGGQFLLYSPIPEGHEARYRFKPLSTGCGYYYLVHEFSGKYMVSGDLENMGKIWLWGPIPKGHEDRYKFRFTSVN